jgi:hypothetical protein
MSRPIDRSWRPAAFAAIIVAGSLGVALWAGTSPDPTAASATSAPTRPQIMTSSIALRWDAATEAFIEPALGGPDAAAAAPELTARAVRSIASNELGLTDHVWIVFHGPADLSDRRVAGDLDAWRDVLAARLGVDPTSTEWASLPWGPRVPIVNLTGRHGFQAPGPFDSVELASHQTRRVKQQLTVNAGRVGFIAFMFLALQFVKDPDPLKMPRWLRRRSADPGTTAAGPRSR